MRMKAQSRRYDETVSLQKPERTGASEIGSVKEQRREEVEVLRPEISAVQSEDLSETRSGLLNSLWVNISEPFRKYVFFIQDLLETVPGHFNSLGAILLESLESITEYSCPIQFPILTGHRSGTGFKQEQDAKGVNSFPGKKGNLNKKKTKDNGVTSFAPPRKKNLLFIFMVAFSGNYVVSAEGDCRCAEHTYLKVNEEGTIQCSFNEPYSALGWLPKPLETPYISIQNRQQTGAGYKSGDYEMYPNGSLIIKNVTSTGNHNRTLVYAPSGDQAPVYCVVQVTVYAIGGPDHPVVNRLVDESAVTLHVHGHMGPVNCTVTRTNPAVDLYFDYPTDVLSLHTSPLYIAINADGTFNTSIWASFTVHNKSVGTVSLSCRSKGEFAEWFPSATPVLLVLQSSYPMVNGSANMQIVVLNVSQEDTLTCSMSRIPVQSSLEFKLTQPNSEIEVANSTPVFRNNSDETHNVTITSKLRIRSHRRPHVRIQCGVSGGAADTYREVTTVHFDIRKDDMYDILPTSEPRNCTFPWIMVALLTLVIIICIGVICWKYCRKVRTVCTLTREDDNGNTNRQQSNTPPMTYNRCATDQDSPLNTPLQTQPNGIAATNSNL